MTLLTCAIVSTILGLVTSFSINPKHQYENYYHAQPPTGPEFHHFFGQGGFDPFGKILAQRHVYSGPYSDQGPIRAVQHPFPYGEMQHSPSEQLIYKEVPSYDAYPVYIEEETKKANPFKDLENKMKDYGKKFTKLVSGYMDYQETPPSYQEPYYYEEEDSFSKKLVDGAKKVKSEIEKFGEKAASDLKKVEEDAKKKIKELFEYDYTYEEPKKEKGFFDFFKGKGNTRIKYVPVHEYDEPYDAPAPHYGPPESTYGAPPY